MGATKLRYADSGPFVTNEEGFAASPREGFQTRSVYVSSVSGSAFATAQNDVPITTTVAELLDVRRAARYRAAMELHIYLKAAWSTSGRVAYSFQYSADEGSTWTTWHTTSVDYEGGGSGSPRPADIYVQTLPVLGSALTGLADGNTMRVRVLKPLTGGDDEQIGYCGNPSYVLQLIEEL